jgi:hypothetical protein
MDVARYGTSEGAYMGRDDKTRRDAALERGDFGNVVTDKGFNLISDNLNSSLRREVLIRLSLKIGTVHLCGESMAQYCG